MSDAFPTLHNTEAAPPIKSRLWIPLTIAGVLATAGLAAWYVVGQYNQLQYNDMAVDVSWKQTINQYTRRTELVPNLVTVVQGYARHETALFSEIASTRAGLAQMKPPARSDDRGNVAQFEQAHRQLAGQVSRLITVAEGYPELKASALYQDLMAQLEGTENRIAYARQTYIDSVASHNFGLRRFPTSLIAAQAGLRPCETGEFANTSVVLKPVVLQAR